MLHRETAAVSSLNSKSLLSAYCLHHRSAFDDQPPTTDQRPLANGDFHDINKIAEKKKKKRSGVGLFYWFMLDELLETIL
ncbi:hypothetical protein J6590_054900 [Homalodisca vitripennis]|nr:hypothetical protein J6590_054900 [Homalodisca vitripennis]